LKDSHFDKVSGKTLPRNMPIAEVSSRQQFRRRLVSIPCGRLMLAVAIGLSIGLLLLSMRRFDRLANSPLSEDGFYQLAIARHLALGHGITIDGHTWTNGFQPYRGRTFRDAAAGVAAGLAV
jgi:hypothetical protein